MQNVDWTKLQSHWCYFYSGRDCPGWYPGQPCSPICHRIQQKVGEIDIEAGIPYTEINIDASGGCKRVSLKCKLYGENPHEPCSGTCECTEQHPCKHWCHDAER